MDTNAQLWYIVREYITNCEEHGVNTTDIISFLLELSFHVTGKAYNLNTLSDRQRSIVKDLTDFGLVKLQQIKDIAIKASGAYKNCRPCSGLSGRDQGWAYTDSDVHSVSERYYVSYRRTGSSNSMPRLWGKELEAKLKAFSSGSTTPASVSGRTELVLFMEEDEPKEWVAQVEPGVLITFVSLPQGGNDLKRI